MKQFIYPYIMMKDSKEAASYYCEIFDGEITYTMLGKDTPNCPADQLDRVMHLEVRINNNMFYFSDKVVGDYDGMELHLDYEDKDLMFETFKRLSEGSKVIQDLGPTFWGATFGIIKDRFGVTWQFHHIIREEE